jgi:hypothetical protein
MSVRSVSQDLVTYEALNPNRINSWGLNETCVGIPGVVADAVTGRAGTNAREENGSAVTR